MAKSQYASIKKLLAQETSSENLKDALSHLELDQNIWGKFAREYYDLDPQATYVLAATLENHIFVQNGKVDPEIFAKLVQKSKNPAEKCYNNFLLAQIWEKLGNREKAYEALNEASKIDSQLVNFKLEILWKKLDIAERNSQDIDLKIIKQVQEEFEKLNGIEAEVAINLCKGKLANNTEEAKIYFEAALIKMPSNIRANLAMADYLSSNTGMHEKRDLAELKKVFKIADSLIIYPEYQKKAEYIINFATREASRYLAVDLQNILVNKMVEENRKGFFRSFASGELSRIQSDNLGVIVIGLQNFLEKDEKFTRVCLNGLANELIANVISKHQESLIEMIKNGADEITLKSYIEGTMSDILQQAPKKQQKSLKEALPKDEVIIPKAYLNLQIEEGKKLRNKEVKHLKTKEQARLKLAKNEVRSTSKKKLNDLEKLYNKNFKSFEKLLEFYEKTSQKLDKKEQDLITKISSLEERLKSRLPNNNFNSQLAELALIKNALGKNKVKLPSKPSRLLSVQQQLSSHITIHQITKNFEDQLKKIDIEPLLEQQTIEFNDQIISFEQKFKLIEEQLKQSEKALRKDFKKKQTEARSKSESIINVNDVFATAGFQNAFSKEVEKLFAKDNNKGLEFIKAAIGNKKAVLTLVKDYKNPNYMKNIAPIITLIGEEKFTGLKMDFFFEKTEIYRTAEFKNKLLEAIKVLPEDGFIVQANGGLAKIKKIVNNNRTGNYLRNIKPILSAIGIQNLDLIVIEVSQEISIKKGAEILVKEFEAIAKDLSKHKISQNQVKDRIKTSLEKSMFDLKKLDQQKIVEEFVKIASEERADKSSLGLIIKFLDYICKALTFGGYNTHAQAITKHTKEKIVIFLKDESKTVNAKEYGEIGIHTRRLGKSSAERSI